MHLAFPSDNLHFLDRSNFVGKCKCLDQQRPIRLPPTTAARKSPNALTATSDGLKHSGLFRRQRRVLSRQQRAGLSSLDRRCTACST